MLRLKISTSRLKPVSSWRSAPLLNSAYDGFWHAKRLSFQAFALTLIAPFTEMPADEPRRSRAARRRSPASTCGARCRGGPPRRDRLDRARLNTELPLLCGPSTTIIWTKGRTTNAFEEAQARRDHWEGGEVESEEVAPRERGGQAESQAEPSRRGCAGSSSSGQRRRRPTCVLLGRHFRVPVYDPS